jgi:glycosyltransferase involved in cell wall biosynthesis
MNPFIANKPDEIVECDTDPHRGGPEDASHRLPSTPDTSSAPRLRIVMLVGELGIGGAERQAVTLAEALQRQGHHLCVATLADGPLREDIEAIGLPLVVLHRPLNQSSAAVPALRRLLHRVQPDVVYAFLDLQWLLALAARGRRHEPRVVLGLRSSDYGLPVVGTRGRVVQWMTRHASGYADLLVANSQQGLHDFSRHARRIPHGVVMPNGIDLSQFAANADARLTSRAEWSIPTYARVVGHVGRLHPVKDHERLLSAFAHLRALDPDCYLVCVGDGAPERFTELRRLAVRLGIADHVRFAGPAAHMPSAYSAFDALVLCSKREGFPNAVAEGMACGVPAVVTDVGACAEIVGELGEIVRDPSAETLGSAIARLLGRGSAALSKQCRERVLSRYTIDEVAARTAALFVTLTRERAAA